MEEGVACYRSRQDASNIVILQPFHFLLVTNCFPFVLIQLNFQIELQIILTTTTSPPPPFQNASLFHLNHLSPQPIHNSVNFHPYETFLTSQGSRYCPRILIIFLPCAILVLSSNLTNLASPNFAFISHLVFISHILF